MKIALLSDDRNLYDLCRNVLTNAQRYSWTLSAVTDPAGVAEADFYICDIGPDISLPAYLESTPARCLLIVERDDLDRFRKSAGGAALNILLKPVTRAMLAAFLDIVFTIFDSRSSGANNESPAEYVLQTSLRLQKHDRERSAFLASVAHDLRAPATALLGYSGLLLDPNSGSLDEKQRAILRHMQHSARRLSRMAAAIFDLSVELQSAHRLDLEPGDASSCVDQAWHEVALIAADKKIPIGKQIEPFDEELYFDRALIERALINLLENACRFTPMNGRIAVRGYPFFWERRNANAGIPGITERRSSVACKPNCYRIDVWNSGPAIPPELLDYIFEQYVTLEPDRGKSGCGLGLAICRTIVARHQGHIWAQNTESGPMFSFVLPGGRPSGTRMGTDRPHKGQPRNDTIRLLKTHVAI